MHSNMPLSLPSHTIPPHVCSSCQFNPFSKLASFQANPSATLPSRHHPCRVNIDTWHGPCHVNVIIMLAQISHPIMSHHVSSQFFYKNGSGPIFSLLPPKWLPSHSAHLWSYFTCFHTFWEKIQIYKQKFYLYPQILHVSTPLFLNLQKNNL